MTSDVIVKSPISVGDGRAPWIKYHFPAPGVYMYTASYNNGQENPWGAPFVRYLVPELVNGEWRQRGEGYEGKNDRYPHVTDRAWRSPSIDSIEIGDLKDRAECSPPIEEFHFPLVVGDSWGGWVNCSDDPSGPRDLYEHRTVLRKEPVKLGDGSQVDAVVIFRHNKSKGSDINFDTIAWVLPSNGLSLYEEWADTSWRRLQRLTPGPL